MKPRKATYLGHRWLGLLVSLQLLAWSLGGFLFSILPLDLVRGERDMVSTPFVQLEATAVEFIPESIRASVSAFRRSDGGPATVALVDRGLGPAWELRDVGGALVTRLDPANGDPLPLITPDEARTLAVRDFAHEPGESRVTLIESDPPVEYRSGQLPAYLVELDHAKRPHIYVDAETGQVTARRNRSWRVFDFFWMLHTMDYAGRDNFNHLLLTGFSLLAIFTSASGLTLWGWRFTSRFRAFVNRARRR